MYSCSCFLHDQEPSRGGSGGEVQVRGAFDERAHNFAPFMFYSPILASAPTKESKIKNFHFLFILFLWRVFL